MNNETATVESDIRTSVPDNPIPVNKPFRTLDVVVRDFEGPTASRGKIGLVDRESGEEIGNLISAKIDYTIDDPVVVHATFLVKRLFSDRSCGG